MQLVDKQQQQQHRELEQCFEGKKQEKKSWLVCVCHAKEFKGPKNPEANANVVGRQKAQRDAAREACSDERSVQPLWKSTDNTKQMPHIRPAETCGKITKSAGTYRICTTTTPLEAGHDEQGSNFSCGVLLRPL